MEQGLKTYYKEHRKRSRKLHNKQEVDRKKSPQYHKAANGRSVRWSLIFGKSMNQDTYRYQIGCSIAQFRFHIESQFTEGMSWLNYGRGENRWNLEDFKPLSAFDLTDRDQYHEAFNWRNCQPLWHIANMHKGIQYSEEAYQQRLQKYK